MHVPYYRLFQNWGVKVETEREVFSRARTIDLVVTCSTEAEREQLQNTVFSHFRQLNALELKGFHDPLTIDNFNRIMMRAWGMGVKKSVPNLKNRLIQRTTKKQKPQTSPLNWLMK